MLKNTNKIRNIFIAAHGLSFSQSKNLLERYSVPIVSVLQRRGKKDNSNISALFTPIAVKPSADDINVGAELTGEISKPDLLKVLSKFYQTPEIKQLLLENGLDNYLQHQVYVSFRKYCLEAKPLPVEMHIVFNDALQGAANVTDLFPYFIKHAKIIFPHLECMDDLKKISDLRSPAYWFPEARAMSRKIIFHAGPTNSGKTYHALERFMTAKSGVYCGPLKLLAVEVFNKTNKNGTPCDLVTGEERNFVDPSGNPSNHVSCTVEMTSLNNVYEVAVIDEIQMIKDPQRGWAWTRALLGLRAEEIHLCGEPGTIDLIKQLSLTTGEDIEVRNYKRLTSLKIEDTAVGSLNNILPGDCVVCFSKNDIYSVSRGIEATGKEVAVIYGGLPPGTKLAQAAKFNDPNNSCKVLVATDAVGMGLNLSIRRIIFYSLIKPVMNEKGEKEMDTISISQALQIAGRAGRYGTQWEQGYVTTFKPEDLNTLKALLASQPEPITQAGLHPTAEQIELYAFHLPNATFSNLMEIFVNLSTVDDSLYFMCNIEDFKFLADMIQHVPLALRARYIFCCAPINKKMPFVCTMFLKFSRQYSKNEPITFDWLCRNIGWPLQPPKTIIDLIHLEGVFDVLDLYLWLSYRFSDLFIEPNLVRDIQRELDQIIQEGIIHITRLLKNSETGASSGISEAIADEDEFSNTVRRQNYLRDSKHHYGKGKLTERLLAQGILTPSMLQELKKEWNKKERPGFKGRTSYEDPTYQNNEYESHPKPGLKARGSYEDQKYPINENESHPKPGFKGRNSYEDSRYLSNENESHPKRGFKGRTSYEDSRYPSNENESHPKPGYKGRNSNDDPRYPSNESESHPKPGYKGRNSYEDPRYPSNENESHPKPGYKGRNSYDDSRYPNNENEYESNSNDHVKSNYGPPWKTARKRKPQ